MQNRTVVVDEGRSAVRAAFGFIFVPGESPTAYFSGGQKPPAKRSGRKRWTTAHRVHATPSRAAGYSRPNLSGQQPLLGFVHRCIGELNPLEQNWIHFRYRQPCHKRDEAGHKFLRAYSDQFAELHLKNSRPGTRAVVREMAAFRMRQAVGDIPLSAQFESINGAMSRQVWAKGYRPHWISICNDLDRIDEAALFKVGVKLQFHADLQGG